MLSMEVALVSSLGQNAVRIISPDSSKKSQGIESMALLGHEEEYHYHSLEPEVSTAGLTYRQPPTPGDGNCLFHAMSDQLKRLDMPEQTAAQLRKAVVEYL